MVEAVMDIGAGNFDMEDDYDRVLAGVERAVSIREDIQY